MATYEDNPFCRHGHDWAYSAGWRPNGHRYCKLCVRVQRDNAKARAATAKAKADLADAQHYAGIALYASKRVSKTKRKRAQRLAKARAKATLVPQPPRI